MEGGAHRAEGEESRRSQMGFFHNMVPLGLRNCTREARMTC